MVRIGMLCGAFAIVAAMAFGPSPSQAASSAGHVTGVGGVVVMSKDPRALAKWYRDMLGIKLEPWGGAMFRIDAPGHPPYTVWSAFKRDAKEFAHARRDVMLNLSVDDLDAMCTRFKAHNIAIFERQNSAYGKFASVIDPDGTKIELWEAPKH